METPLPTITLNRSNYICDDLILKFERGNSDVVYPCGSHFPGRSYHGRMQKQFPFRGTGDEADD